MKSIIAILLFAGSAIGQPVLNVTYSLDTVGGKDSFFLVETITKKIAESPRPQETQTSILFKDTSELIAYIARMRADRISLATRLTQLEAQLDLLDSRITVIQALRDSVLPLLGNAVTKSANAPPEPAQAPKQPKKKAKPEATTQSKKSKTKKQ